MSLEHRLKVFSELGMDEAIVNYQAALAVETTPYKKLDLMARLIRLFGLEKKQPDKVEELLGQVEKSGPTNQSDDETWAAYRRAIVAAGDVRLWSEKRDEAQELYKRAEVLARTMIPPQVRDARLGSFPNSMREYLAEKNFRDATDLLDKVEWDFPTTKVKGQTFFWRGKTQALQGQSAEATRFLVKSLELAVGANFETEARWLLAESLEKSGQAEQAQKELAKLVASGLKDQFTVMALEKLKQQKK